MAVSRGALFAAAVATAMLASTSTSPAAAWDQYDERWIVHEYTFYNDPEKTSVHSTVWEECTQYGAAFTYSFSGTQYYDKEARYLCTASGPAPLPY